MSSLTREILGVSQKSKTPKVFGNLISSIAPKTKKIAIGKKQSREVADLLKGENVKMEISPPKERTGWAKIPFENPARSDGFQLRHWEKKRFPRPPGYGGALGVIPFPLPPLPAGAQFPGWSHPALVELWENCRETELRFPVVGDRLGIPVEEIKNIFFSLARDLEIPNYRPKGIFDISAEKQRREIVEEKLSGNLKSPDELKKAQADLKAFRDSAAESQKLLSDPQEAERRNFQVWLASEEKPEIMGARVAKLRSVEGAHRKLRHCHKIRHVDLEISKVQELVKNLKNFIKRREAEILDLKNKT